MAYTDYGFYTNISTHSLTRRLTGRNLRAGIPALNFNSQPHKEADDFSYTDGPDAVISTHSLTRRLTAVLMEHATKIAFQLTASQGG